MNAQTDRIRLVLVTTPLPDGPEGVSALRRALSGGDVASVIIDGAGRDAAQFQDFALEMVEVAQAAGAAAIICDDTRCAGRLKADGIHVSTGLEDLGDAVARFSPKLIVGASGFDTRHDALEAGERLPDYLFFGTLAHDAAEVDPEALDMAGWWAEIVEVPCILMGGADLETLPDAIASRTEFVALSFAVFGASGEEAERVAQANRMLDAAVEPAAA